MNAAIQRIGEKAMWEALQHSFVWGSLVALLAVGALFSWYCVELARFRRLKKEVGLPGAKEISWIDVFRELQRRGEALTKARVALDHFKRTELSYLVEKSGDELAGIRKRNDAFEDAARRAEESFHGLFGLGKWAYPREAAGRTAETFLDEMLQNDTPRRVLCEIRSWGRFS